MSKLVRTNLRDLLDVAGNILFILLLATLLVRFWVPPVRPLAEARRVTAPAAAQGNVPSTPLSLEDAVTKGSENARVVMVIYSDFECPYCATFATDRLPELEKRYVDTGQVLIVFRHFPLESIHPTAIQVAGAAECAADQGHFWPMHDALFRNRKSHSDRQLRSYAITLGLDLAKFDECMTGAYVAKVRGDVTGAATVGITGTPTVLIGERLPGGLVRTTQRLVGAQPVQAFANALDALLKQVNTQ